MAKKKKLSTEQKLTRSLRGLKVSIDRSNSLRWRFMLGIVQGIGAVVGASVVAGLVLGWLATTFDTASSIPFVGPYFSDISEMFENGDTSTTSN